MTANRATADLPPTGPQRGADAVPVIDGEALRTYRLADEFASTLFGKLTEERDEVADPSDAHLFGSLRHDGRHVPFFDLDFPARLVPSGTPGHWHLVLDRPISRRAYARILRAMVRAGLVERRYYLGFLWRGQTFLRVPWRPKQRAEQTEDAPMTVLRGAPTMRPQPSSPR